MSDSALSLGTGSAATAHLLVCWVDYQMSPDEWVMGGPNQRHGKQGVVRLDKPLTLIAPQAKPQEAKPAKRARLSGESSRATGVIALSALRPVF